MGVEGFSFSNRFGKNISDGGYREKISVSYLTRMKFFYFLLFLVILNALPFDYIKSNSFPFEYFKSNPLKLMYFNSKGRAEAIRYKFANFQLIE